MSLIVEDGTGKSNAESLISVAEADTYHANRGNSTWAALSTTAKEQSLRKSADYMEQVYRLRWAGWRVTDTQALSWPRAFVPRGDVNYIYSFYANDAVPTLAANACAELALKASTATLFADQTQQAIREKVGPIETEYSPHSSQAIRYVAIDAMLAPLLASGGNSMRMAVVRQ